MLSNIKPRTTNNESRFRTGDKQMIKVNGKDYPWEEGLTVTQLLDKKGFTFPLLVVIINGKSIAENNYAHTVIEDGDYVQVIHLISGG